MEDNKYSFEGIEIRKSHRSNRPKKKTFAKSISKEFLIPLALTGSDEGFLAIKELYDYIKDVTGSEFNQFTATFPFSDFYNLATTMGETEYGIFAYCCFSYSSFSKKFPYENYSSPDILSFFVNNLNHADSRMQLGSIFLLTNMFAVKNHNIAEFLLNQTHLLEFAQQIINEWPMEIAQLVYFISSYSNGLIEVIINSYLTVFLQSNNTVIRQHACKIIVRLAKLNAEVIGLIKPLFYEVMPSYLNESDEDFVISFLKCLTVFDDLPNIVNQLENQLRDAIDTKKQVNSVYAKQIISSKVISLFADVLSMNFEYWSGDIDQELSDFCVELFEDQSFEAQKSLIKILVLYHHDSNQDSLQVYQYYFLFITDPDIGQLCLQKLSTVLANNINNSDILEIFSDVNDEIEQLLDSSDPGINELAKSISLMLNQRET